MPNNNEILIEVSAYLRAHSEGLSQPDQLLKALEKDLDASLKAIEKKVKKRDVKVPVNIKVALPRTVMIDQAKVKELVDRKVTSLNNKLKFQLKPTLSFKLPTKREIDTALKPYISKLTTEVKSALSKVNVDAKINLDPKVSGSKTSGSAVRAAPSRSTEKQSQDLEFTLARALSGDDQDAVFLRPMLSELQKLRREIQKEAVSAHSEDRLTNDYLKQLNAHTNEVERAIENVSRNIQSLSKLDTRDKVLVQQALSQATAGTKSDAEIITNLDKLSKGQLNDLLDRYEIARAAGDIEGQRTLENAISKLRGAIDDLRQEMNDRDSSLRDRKSAAAVGTIGSGNLNAIQAAEMEKVLPGAIREAFRDKDDVLFRELSRQYKDVREQLGKDRNLSETDYRRLRSFNQGFLSGIGGSPVSTTRKSDIGHLDTVQNNQGVVKRILDGNIRSGQELTQLEGKVFKSLQRMVSLLDASDDSLEGFFKSFREVEARVRSVANERVGQAGRLSRGVGFPIAGTGLSKAQASKLERALGDYTKGLSEANDLAGKQGQLRAKSRLLTFLGGVDTHKFSTDQNQKFDEYMGTLVKDVGVLKREVMQGAEANGVDIPDRSKNLDTIAAARLEKSLPLLIQRAIDSGNEGMFRHLTRLQRGIKEELSPIRNLSDVEFSKLTAANTGILKQLGLPEIKEASKKQIKALDFLQSNNLDTQRLLARGFDDSRSPTELERKIFESLRDSAKLFDLSAKEADSFTSGFRALERQAKSAQFSNQKAADNIRELTRLDSSDGINLKATGLSRSQANKLDQFSEWAKSINERPIKDDLDSIRENRDFTRKALSFLRGYDVTQLDESSRDAIQKIKSKYEDHLALVNSMASDARRSAKDVRGEYGQIENEVKRFTERFKRVDKQQLPIDLTTADDYYRDTKNLFNSFDKLSEKLRSLRTIYSDEIASRKDLLTKDLHPSTGSFLSSAKRDRYNEEIARFETFGARLGEQIAVLNNYSPKTSELHKTGKREHEIFSRGLAGSAASQGQTSLLISQFARLSLGFAALGGVTTGFFLLGEQLVTLDKNLKSVQAAALTTSRAMEDIRSSVLNVAVTTKFTVSEISEAAKILAQADVSVKDLPQTLRATALFGAATDSDLPISADILSTFRKVYGNLDDIEISNLLTKAINLAKLTAEEMQTILGISTQVAKDMGLTGEQFLSAVVVLRNQGLKASTTATGFRQALIELFSPDSKTTKVLAARYAELGESLTENEIAKRFQAFRKEANPLISVIQELRRIGVGGGSSSNFARFIDIRAINALLPLVKNIDELAKREFELPFGESALEASNIQMESLAASAQNLGAAITSLSDDAFRPMIEGLAKAAQSATEFLGSVKEAHNLNVSAGGDGSFGAATAAVAGGAVASLFRVNSLAKKVGAVAGGTVAGGTAGLQGLQEGIDVGEAANIALALVGVIATITGIGKVFRSKGGVENLTKITGSVEKVSDTLSTVGGLGGKLATLVGRFSSLIPGIGTFIGVLTTIYSVYSFLSGPDLEEQVNAAKRTNLIYETKIQELQESLKQLTATTGQTISAVIGRVRRANEVLEATISSLGITDEDNSLDSVKDLIRKLIKDGGEATSSIYKDLADRIKALNGNLSDTQVADYINKLQVKMNDVDQGVEANRGSLIKQFERIRDRLRQADNDLSELDNINDRALFAAFQQLNEENSKYYETLLFSTDATVDEIRAATDRLNELAVENAETMANKEMEEYKTKLEESVTNTAHLILAEATDLDKAGDDTQLKVHLNHLADQLALVSDNSTEVVIAMRKAIEEARLVMLSKAKKDIARLRSDLATETRLAESTKPGTEASSKRESLIEKIQKGILTGINRVSELSNRDSDTVNNLNKLSDSRATARTTDAFKSLYKNILDANTSIEKFDSNFVNLKDFDPVKAGQLTSGIPSDKAELSVFGVTIGVEQLNQFKRLRAVREQIQDVADDVGKGTRPSQEQLKAIQGVVTDLNDTESLLSKTLTLPQTLRNALDRKAKNEKDAADIKAEVAAEPTTEVLEIKKARAEELKLTKEAVGFQKEIRKVEREVLTESIAGLEDSIADRATDAGASFDRNKLREDEQKLAKLRAELDTFDATSERKISETRRKATPRKARSSTRVKTKEQVEKETIDLAVKKLEIDKKALKEQLEFLSLEGDLLGNADKRRALTDQVLMLDAEIAKVKGEQYNLELARNKAISEEVTQVSTEALSQVAELTFNPSTDPNREASNLDRTVVTNQIGKLNQLARIIQSQLKLTPNKKDTKELVEAQKTLRDETARLAGVLVDDLYQQLAKTEAGTFLLAVQDLKTQLSQPFVTDQFVAFAMNFPGTIIGEMKAQIDEGLVNSLDDFDWKQIGDALRTQLSDVFFNLAERTAQKMVLNGLESVGGLFGLDMDFLKTTEQLHQQAVNGNTQALRDLTNAVLGQSGKEAANPAEPEGGPTIFGAVGKLVTGDVSGSVSDFSEIFKTSSQKVAEGANTANSGLSEVGTNAPALFDSLKGLLSGIGGSLSGLFSGGKSGSSGAGQLFSTVLSAVGFKKGTSGYGRINRQSHSGSDSLKAIGFDGSKLQNLKLGPGESIVTAKATSLWGDKFIDGINDGSITPQGFSTPDITMPAARQTLGSDEQKTDVSVVNLIDDGTIEQAILSSGGRTAVTEVYNELKRSSG